jgi:protein-disulfide isomerase
MLLILQFLLLFCSFDAIALDKDLIPPKKEILRIKELDILLGSEEAPNTIIEYSSLACPHCADYYNQIFPQIKKELINSGKVKYIYRDFPTTRSALYAATTARCLATKDGLVNAETFFRILQLLFKSQNSWAFSGDYKIQLQKLLNLGGFEQERINFCSLGDEEKNQALVAEAFLAIKSLDIIGSPALFLNDKLLENHDFEAIVKQLK